MTPPAVRNPMRSRAAVVGVGQTAFGAIPGFSSLDFGAWALAECLRDAGLEASDIDGLIVMRIPDSSRFCEIAGLEPGWTESFPGAGRWTGPAIETAVMAIACGRARRIALVYGNDGKSAGATYGGASDQYGGGQLWAPYGMTSPGAFHAMLYSRYMAEFGATRADLAEVSVAFRAHAALNPAAVMRKPITAEDHAAAKPIAAPLHLLDYCLINDGGVAMILSAPELAADHLPPPIWVRGTGQASHGRATSFPPDDYWLGAMNRAGAKSYAEAGVTPADMSGLMIYDNFTPTVILSLEGFGYAAPGTAGAAIRDGRLRLGGAWQANTSGGHLSESYMQGWALNVEAVRQLRGECGERQMRAPELIHMMTASPQSSSIVYGVEP